jgi:hypothetical protein
MTIKEDSSLKPTSAKKIANWIKDWTPLLFILVAFLSFAIFGSLEYSYYYKTFTTLGDGWLRVVISFSIPLTIESIRLLALFAMIGAFEGNSVGEKWLGVAFSLFRLCIGIYIIYYQLTSISHMLYIWKVPQETQPTIGGILQFMVILGLVLEIQLLTTLYQKD